MGKITITQAYQPYVIRPAYKVEVYDPQFHKQIKPSNGGQLIPVGAIVWAPGPRGGSAELVHTNNIFSPWDTDDYDKLIGCYVKIYANDDIIFAGVITSAQFDHSQENSVSQVTYKCADLWHALNDQSLTGSFGSTVHQMLTFIQGDNPFSDTWISMYQARPPKVPYNKKWEPIVTINLANFGTSYTRTPRHFKNVEVGSMIADLASELNVAMVAIRPSEKDDKLGEVEAIEYSEKPRAIIIGGASDTDYDEPKYGSRVSSISGTMDSNGIVTDIRVYGGEITQSVATRLIPAWPAELTADVLADPTLPTNQPHVYGAVGRMYYADISPSVYGLVPFSDSASPRYLYDDNEWADHPANTSDAIKIWEYGGGIGDEDKSDDLLWSVTKADYVFLQYNNEMAWTKQITLDGVSSLSWKLHNTSVIMFREPQLNSGWILDGGYRVYDENYAGPRVMVLTGTRSNGNLYAATGNRGKFPRSRYRYVEMPEWRKHTDTFHNSAELDFWDNRYKPAVDGRVRDMASVDFDNTLSMLASARRMANQFSKPTNSITITISGIDLSWWYGDWIKTVADTDGQIVKDNLDWYVTEIEYSLESCETKLIMGERRYVTA